MNQKQSIYEAVSVNNFKFSELYVGMEESFRKIVTEHMLSSYREITGDINPMHCDDHFSQKHGFKAHLVYGLLTTSFLSTLAGVYLPGEKSLIQEVSVKLVKPVYVGDVLTVTGVVSQLNKSVKRMIMDVKITNQADMEVLRGSMKVGVLDD